MNNSTDYRLLIAEASDFVSAYMESHDTEKLSFHNMLHVYEVVEAAGKMATYYKLEERERAIVLIASYFHDLGYCNEGQLDHEIRSAEAAESFLRKHQADAGMIESVKNCILATRMPQSPKNLLEEIVCDADLSHLGTGLFAVRNKL